MIGKEILDEIVRICEEENLTYYLAGGSVLGAIRHGGFIPWDDDIGIMVPREDYEKFAEACKRKLNSNYFYQSIDTDARYVKRFAKVRKNNTIFQEKMFNGIQQHNGIYVDIFPLDNARNQFGIQRM